MTKRLSSSHRKLSAKQQRALEALLVGASDQQAAESAHVSRTTVADWRNKVPAFAEALATARVELLRRTTARLHAATTLAVRALEDVAKDTARPATRVAAARAILEFSYRSRELEEIEERIAKLEAQSAPDDDGVIRIVRRDPSGNAVEVGVGGRSAAPHLGKGERGNEQ